MTGITAKTSRQELASIITKALAEKGISCVLVGGSVVSIYTDNKYESRDLDFISPADHQEIKKVMTGLGFHSVGKDFVHSATEFTVEFPTGPIGLGDRAPVKPEGEIRVKDTKVTLLSPTQCVMDRLAWFYHNNDRQCLEQALEVARRHPIKLKSVEIWSSEEGAEEKFRVFKERLKAAKKT